jgi:hypothetical protein
MKMPSFLPTLARSHHRARTSRESQMRSKPSSVDEKAQAWFVKQGIDPIQGPLNL